MFGFGETYVRIPGRGTPKKNFNIFSDIGRPDAPGADECGKLRLVTTRTCTGKGTATDSRRRAGWGTRASRASLSRKSRIVQRYVSSICAMIFRKKRYYLCTFLAFFYKLDRGAVGIYHLF